MIYQKKKILLCYRKYYMKLQIYHHVKKLGTYTPTRRRDCAYFFTESIMDKMAPSVSHINATKEEETQFETDNLKFIIFLFVFLLIILIVSALIYFYLI